MKSSVPNFYFMYCIFEVTSKNSLSSLWSGRVFHFFSSKSFIVLYCIWRSMIHFQFIFTRGVRFKLTFSLFCILMSNCSSSICWKDYLTPLNPFGLLSKISWSYLCESISRLCSVHWSKCLYQYHTVLIPVALYKVSKSLKFVLAILYILYFHIHFRVSLPISTKSLQRLWLGFHGIYRSIWG